MSKNKSKKENFYRKFEQHQEEVNAILDEFYIEMDKALDDPLCVLPAVPETPEFMPPNSTTQTERCVKKKPL